MSSESTNFVEQIKEVIANATKKIGEYKDASDKFVGDVGTETGRLEKLIKRLQECIKKLTDLKGLYAELIEKINVLESQIITLKEVTKGSITDGKTACDEKLKQILILVKGLVPQVGEFKGDAKKIQDAVGELEKLIEQTCKEGDELLKQQTLAAEAVTRAQNALGADETGGSIEQKSGVEQVRPVTSSAPESWNPYDEDPNDPLPHPWTKYIDPESGSPAYYNSETEQTSWNRPVSQEVVDSGNTYETPPPLPEKREKPKISLGALSKAKTQLHKKKIEAQDYLGAHNAYKDPNDPGRQSLIQDFNNKQFDSKNGGIDAHKYAAKGGKEGRNPDYNVRWATESGKPEYTRVDGKTFNDGIKKDAEFSNRHPSTYPNVAGIAAAKGTSSPVSKGGRRTRKMRGGWQTPERLKSLSKSKPIRTLTTRKRKKKRNKKTKKNKRRRKKRKRKKRKKSKRRR